MAHLTKADILNHLGDCVVKFIEYWQHAERDRLHAERKSKRESKNFHAGRCVAWEKAIADLLDLEVNTLKSFLQLGLEPEEILHRIIKEHAK